ncbi:t-SNARE [Lobosporangium transversale]|uniref:t-SNARE n=1 Tax=Lobosporangium transversale TaxID=64571 RepID=A0A1Y2GC68_9FUNG|nr:t-SNARE [Lobosporangium transversale]ORZ06786.1 t-SNARE [Lobosporangium transversale]|eukprot:XP_021877707.1 t-SNARE [Lobosporangium transversale]
MLEFYSFADYTLLSWLLFLYRSAFFPFLYIYCLSSDVLTSLGNASTLYESWKRILQTVTSAENEELQKTKEELSQILTNIEQDLEDLDDAVKAVTENPQKFNLTTRESNARKQFILMQEQDQQLDSVMHTVLNIREIATTMNGELQDQTMLLDDLDEHVDRTSGNLQKAMRRMNRFIKQNEGIINT